MYISEIFVAIKDDHPDRNELAAELMKLFGYPEACKDGWTAYYYEDVYPSDRQYIERLLGAYHGPYSMIILGEDVDDVIESIPAGGTPFNEGVSRKIWFVP